MNHGFMISQPLMTARHDTCASHELITVHCFFGIEKCKVFAAHTARHGCARVKGLPIHRTGKAQSSTQSQAHAHECVDWQIRKHERGIAHTHSHAELSPPPGKTRRITFIECPQDLHGMLDAAKYADLVLLMIDGAFGFEMETFEFLNLLQVRSKWL